VPLAPRRQLVLALKWLVSQIKVEPEKTLKERITRTFNSLVHKESKKKRTYTNELFSKKKKQYRQAVLDRTNTRFRWI
jgi:ribosomal protein S7